MKKQVIPFVLLWAILLMFAPSAHAQYGNEWINYSKTYYKFKVAADGLYRIPFNTIQAAGLSGQVASGFKLFHKGVEIPIYTTTNGTLANTDYIEFFGEKNTGAYDAQLYEQADWQFNKHVSMFSDTTAYFLVWDNATIGKRYVNQANNVSSPPAAESYFMHTLTNAYRNVHVAGLPFRLGGANHWFADFEDGEGFGSTDISAGTSLEINMPTAGKYTGTGAPNASLAVRVEGRSQEIGIANEHHLNISVNDVVYVNATYDGYENNEYNSDVFLSDISNANTLISVTSVGDLDNDEKNAVAYASLTYPRNFDFSGANRFRFKLANSQQKYIEITNFAGGTNPVLYDLTNNLRLVPVVDNGTYKFLLPQGVNPSAVRDLFLVAAENPCTIGCSFPICNPTQCVFFTVPTLTATQFTNYAAAVNQGDYIIITHRSLRQGTTDWVSQYAAYRESPAGGSYNVMIADIDDLYDQFAAGIPKHPLSIRKFLDYAIDNWNIDPRFVFLIGKSVSYNNFASFYYAANLVPTFGYTPSDNMLSVESPGTYLPRIATGRLSALTPNQVRAYYEKVLEYESDVPCTREARKWTKEVLHVAGAKTNNEYEDFTQSLNNFSNVISSPQYGGNVTTFNYCYEYCNTIPTQNAFPEFDAAFNEGAALVTLFGHSLGSTEWDFPNMYEDPAQFSNFDKYPFIIANSCFVGNIHQYSFSEPNNSLAEKYVLADGLGSIGYLATVFFGIPTYLNTFSDTLYHHLSIDDYGQPIGTSFLETLDSLYNTDENDPNYIGVKITSEEFTYVGDPAVILAGSFDKPEFIVENNGTTNDVQVFNHDTGAPIIGNNLAAGVNSIDIVVHVSNIGQILTGNLSIRIDRQLNGGATQIAAQQLVPNPTSEGTYTFTITVNPASFTGLNTFTVVIDALNQYTEDCEDNNQLSFNLNVQDPNCGGLPQPQFTIAPSFCVGDPAVSLVSNIAGTVFSGDNVSGNSFIPNTPGIKTIIATYTDVNTACVVTSATTVTVNAIPSAAFTPSLLSVCTGNPVTLIPNNFNANTTYSWALSGGTGSGTNQSYSVIWNTPGIKTVTLIAANGNCQSEQSIQINVQAPLVAPNVACTNTSLNSVTFGWNAISGATTYQIYINGNLAQTTPNTAYTVSGLATGEDVTITVVANGTGICGNSPTSAPQTCSAQDCPPLSLSISQLENQTTFCSDDNIVSLTPSQAGSIITVNNVETNILNPATLPTNQPIIVNISYTSGNCDYEDSYTLTVNAAPNVIVTGSSQICQGGSTILNAGENYSSYIWNTGATSSTISVSTAGTYSVTVTNDAGCSDAGLKTVTVAPEPTLDITSGNGGTQICAGGSLSLSATAGFSNYNWSGGGGIGQNISIFGAGTYTVTATDVVGCQWTESITITTSSIQQPVINLNGQTTNPAICGGSSNTLDAGTGYTSYNWSNGDQTQTSTITQAGVYTVTVTNNAGCNAVAAFEVTNANISAPSISATATEICNDATTITAQTGYEAYVWNNGSTTNTITTNEAGIYTVTVTQAACQATQSIAITVSPQSIPTAAFVLTANPTICAGTSITLDNQSQNAQNYLWTVTNTDTNNTQTSTDDEPSFTLNEAGSYSITLQVDAICGTDTDTQQLSTAVTVAAAPSVDLTASPTTVCPGEEVTLTAQTTATSLLWIINNQTTDITAASFTDNPIETTVYLVRAQNSAGCTATDTIQVAIDTECELPNAITPNGDNFNDAWRIPVAYTDTNLKVEIFNRWGQLIWNTSAYNNDTNAFSGRNNNGDEVAHGTYYYIITPSTSLREPLSGHITVLR